MPYVTSVPETASSRSRPALRWILPALAAVVAMLAGGVAVAGEAGAASAPTLRVVGNQLVDASGATVRLVGVNKAGGEFACAQGWGFFDGPVDDATVSLIRSWGANAVRVPLNEQCWLGVNGMNPSFSGQPYRDAVAAFVARLNAAGIVAILDLHWNGAGTTPATSQQPMADADHAPAFWQSVASQFVANPSVVFDLYNEPHDISWECWRDGCTTSAGWQTAGMQSLVDAVRSTGARQPLLVSGLNWAGDLSQWLAYEPHDPLNQLVAGAHIYNFSQCSTSTCWDQTIGTTARVVPVVTSEVGEDDCAGTFAGSYLDWADRNGVGYTAWTWNTWDCSGPALISAYDGTPTALGAVVRSRLQALATAAPSSAPTTSPTPTTTTTPTATASPTTTTTPAPTASPTSTSIATSTLAYGFETTLTPWKSEAAGVTVARSSTYPYKGGYDLSASRSVAAGTWSAIRLNTSGTPLRATAGRSVTAWVRLEAATPGAWKAGLEVQDSGWHWVAGPTTTLVAGSWVKVSFLVPSATWTGSRSFGIQVGGSRSTAGTLKVRVDEVRQSS